MVLIFDLKIFRELEFTASLGRVFHSAKVLGKKENLKVSILALGPYIFKNMTSLN